MAAASLPWIGNKGLLLWIVPSLLTGTFPSGMVMAFQQPRITLDYDYHKLAPHHPPPSSPRLQQHDILCQTNLYYPSLTTMMLFRFSSKNDRSSMTSNKNGWRDHLPHESDIDFYKRIQEVAGDSKTFEQFTLAKRSSSLSSAAAPPTNAISNSTTKDSTVSSPGVVKRGGYQRVEEWHEEQTTRHGGQMSWEERVQFDGLRHGNQIQQNEILRQHLRTF